MSYRKHLLLVGDNLKVREFANALGAAGAQVTLEPLLERALTTLQSLEPLPDGVVFVVPVYWESVGEFVTAARKDPHLARVPIIYLGDFIEANDQVVLKSQGVHTLTLGPVPTAEAVRFILSLT